MFLTISLSLIILSVYHYKVFITFSRVYFFCKCIFINNSISVDIEIPCTVVGTYKIINSNTSLIVNYKEFIGLKIVYQN